MASLVADTHAVLWYLENSPRLSEQARSRMGEAIRSGFPIFVASISIVEITYLVDKRRLTPDQLAIIKDVLRRPDSGFVIVPLTYAIAETLARVRIDEVPDMPDRIIAATALRLGVPLVTRDRKIRSASLDTIW